MWSFLPAAALRRLVAPSAAARPPAHLLRSSAPAALARALSLSPPALAGRAKTPLQDIPLGDELPLHPDTATSISPPPGDRGHPPVHAPSSHETHLSETQLVRQRSLPTSTKALDKMLGRHKPLELKDSDLDETFVRGSGPGGQVINKSSICVSLIHRPTGIRVLVQETRSQEQNRKIARKLLAEKVASQDPTSIMPTRSEIIAAKARLKARRQDKRTRRKYKTTSLDEAEAEVDRLAGPVDAPGAAGEGLDLDLASEEREVAKLEEQEVLRAEEPEEQPAQARREL